jgi:hypothetical protein
VLLLSLNVVLEALYTRPRPATYSLLYKTPNCFNWIEIRTLCRVWDSGNVYSVLELASDVLDRASSVRTIVIFLEEYIVTAVSF